MFSYMSTFLRHIYTKNPAYIDLCTLLVRTTSRYGKISGGMWHSAGGIIRKADEQRLHRQLAAPTSLMVNVACGLWTQGPILLPGDWVVTNTTNTQLLRSVQSDFSYQTIFLVCINKTFCRKKTSSGLKSYKGPSEKCGEKKCYVAKKNLPLVFVDIRRPYFCIR